MGTLQRKEKGSTFITRSHFLEIDGQYETDPVEDLKPVCPNCHAMLHQKSPPHNIEELKEKMLSAEASER